MFVSLARRRSLAIYHLHLGGPDADALEMQSLLAPRYARRIQQLGIRAVDSPAEADILVATGLLTARNLPEALSHIGSLPDGALLLTAGDSAIHGGTWARLLMPGLAPHPLSHYAVVALTVPGDPPTPQALLGALAEAARLLSRPTERTPGWEEE